MRTWLLTNTTYGTWLPGDRRGSVTSIREPGFKTRIEYDLPGEPYVESIPGLVESARQNMNGEPIHLNARQAAALVKQFHDTALHRQWIILALSIMHNHFHMVVEVPGDPPSSKILGDFKAWGTRCLTQEFGSPRSETWWTSGGSKRLLRDDAAVSSAIHYVLKKQANPLIVWPEEDAETPAADAGRLDEKMSSRPASAAGANPVPRDRP